MKLFNDRTLTEIIIFLGGDIKFHSLVMVTKRNSG